MRLSPCLWALLVLGCASSPPSIVGKWDTAQGLELTLGSDGRFSMGGKAGGEDFAGTWKLDEKTLRLRTTTLRGKPVDVELSRRLAMDSAPGTTLKQRADALASLRKNLDLTLTANAKGTELAWAANGQVTTFSRVASAPGAMTEADIAAGLRKGMDTHEVMVFFRTNESMASGLPGDPSRSVSEFQMDPDQGDQTVRVTFHRIKGREGVESVEIIDGGHRRKVAIH